MKRKIRTILCVMLVISFCLSGCGNDFDAKSYVQAVLDQKFQGEFKEASKIMKVSEYELKQDYEKEIKDFVYTYLTGGYEEISDYLFYEYQKLVEEIFTVMKYDVKKSEKTGDREYEVAVEIQPVDIFITYIDELKKMSAEIEESAKNGGYTGTQEEIEEQMETDYLNWSYELLENSYMNMKYSEKETVLLKVTGNKKQVYSIKKDEFDHLITAFFRMDEIQE